MELKPINRNIEDVTIEQIENHKIISDEELLNDLKNICNYKIDARDNKNSFYGNPFLYHFQFKNLIKCRRENGETIYDIYNDKKKWDKLILSAKNRNRGGKTTAGNVYECFRIDLGSVVMYKATTAKYLYQKYGATSVLDPTAGWGGRMLGAWALGIDYTGIDTNTSMKTAYDRMIEMLDENSSPLFKKPKLQMLWQNALDVDFSKLEYDFVLTSPPYINLEIYEHMVPWNSDKQFYDEFFIPLWEKCMENIKQGGMICFNISPKMYEDAVAFGLPASEKNEDLKQQLGQQTGKKKQDKIYIWSKK